MADMRLALGSCALRGMSYIISRVAKYTHIDRTFYKVFGLAERSHMTLYVYNLASPGLI